MPTELFTEPMVPQHGDQHLPEVRRNQAEFQAMFGDFKARHVVSFWVGPAPQGEWMGMLFNLEDGKQVKVAIPITLFQRFGNEFVLAMMTAGELAEAAYSAKGSA